MYANTEIAADREQRGRRSAGIGENAERLPTSRAATRPLARFGIWRGEETVQPVKYSGGSRLRRGQEHDFATVTQSVNMARARFRLVFLARLCQAWTSVGRLLPFGCGGFAKLSWGDNFVPR